MRTDIHKVLARNLVNLKMNVITIETVNHYALTSFPKFHFFFSNFFSAHCEMAPMEFVCMTLKILTDFLCGGSQLGES